MNTEQTRDTALQSTSSTKEEIQAAARDAARFARERGFGVVYPLIVAGAVSAGDLGEFIDLWTPPAPA